MVRQQQEIETALRLRSAIDAAQAKIFLCFGTLLRYVRDRVFNIDEDVDLGVVAPAPRTAIEAFESVYGPPIARVIDDATRVPFKVEFRDMCCRVDLYCWRRRNGMYYHTFDHQLKAPANGILPEYEFKGIPAACFDVDARTIERYQMDIRYGRTMANCGTWHKPVPQFPEEGIELPLPFGYGQCLDWWYPEWATRRPQFGVSLAADRFTVKTCRGLTWDK